MPHRALDQPWHRPGALAYARARRRAALHPPVTVYPMPADMTKDEDVAVTMRDGVDPAPEPVASRGRRTVPGDPVGPSLRQGRRSHEEARSGGS